MDGATTRIFLNEVGYTLRGVAASCRITLGGTPPWLIDVAAQPIAVRPAGQESAELELEFEADDVLTILRGLEPATLDLWIESGRIRTRGGPGVVGRLRSRLKEGVAKRQYAEIDDWIRDPRFVFMNHGFVELDGSDDFSWVKPGDEPWRYSLNLVRHVTRGVELAGKQVLDVGCGRGGACSYVARYHAPSEVVGADVLQEHVDFCAAAHKHPVLRFVQGDAQDLPFEDCRFDVVMNVESSHCYPRLDKFLSEVRRVLRPDGVFCYTDTLPAGGFEARGEALRQAGADVHGSRLITAEVAEALQQCREPFLRLMREMVREDLGNAAFIEKFADALLRSRQDYLEGRWDYGSWQAVFPRG